MNVLEPAPILWIAWIARRTRDPQPAICRRGSLPVEAGNCQRWVLDQFEFVLKGRGFRRALGIAFSLRL